MKAAYSGWPVFARASQVRAAEEAWSVEVGVAAVEMYADGYNNRAKLRCQALVRYVAKAPTHDSLPQALDIATSLGAFLNHATMAMEDPDAPGNRVAVGEIVRDVRVFTEAETVMRGGVRVPTGGVQVILQWEDELTVTPDIVIAGYTVTSPDRPPAQPGIDPPILQEITSISLTMPPRQRLRLQRGCRGRWVARPLGDKPRHQGVFCYGANRGRRRLRLRRRVAVHPATGMAWARWKRIRR